MGSIENPVEVPLSFEPDVLQQEVVSEATLPLLNFLTKSSPNPTTESLVDNLHQRTINVGVERPPEIPDESAQLEPTLTALINNGLQKPQGSPKVTIVGAGVSGLCAGYELKKAGYDVQILEASSRVGGRVKTFREPTFAPGLHGEGGAMRIPGNHFLLRQYIKDFGLEPQLFKFEMTNKFIYLSSYGEPGNYGRRMTYDHFNDLLISKDPSILKLFPNLNENEKGKTVDTLFADAVKPVVNDFWKAYWGSADPVKGEVKPDPDKTIRAYKAITDKYDKYSLRSYFTDVAGWSLDAMNLFDLGNAHVVFENGFIESFKDAFLSSNDQGDQAAMQQLQPGMDAVPLAFISPDRGSDSLIDNIKFGAKVRHLSTLSSDPHSKVRVEYETQAGTRATIDSDYLILAIPYTAQRLVTKSQPFAPKQEMAIHDVRYVEVTKILLQYKLRWWEDIFVKEKQAQDGDKDGGLVSDLPIRYTMFPKADGNSQFDHSKRGVIMAAYTFEQDATDLSAMAPERRIQIAAENLDQIFPEAKSLDLLEVGASQCFPSDELAGGSAFCYFGPTQKNDFLPTMLQSDWNDRVFFAGEHASFSHGWIQGALEAALRCCQQIAGVSGTKAS